MERGRLTSYISLLRKVSNDHRRGRSDTCPSESTISFILQLPSHLKASTHRHNNRRTLPSIEKCIQIKFLSQHAFFASVIAILIPLQPQGTRARQGLTNSATHSMNQCARVCRVRSHERRKPGRGTTSSMWRNVGGAACVISRGVESFLSSGSLNRLSVVSCWALSFANWVWRGGGGEGRGKETEITKTKE